MIFSIPPSVDAIHIQVFDDASPMDILLPSVDAPLQSTVEDINQFQVDSAVKVEVKDSKTGEVVRQIPTVEMIDSKEQGTNSGKLYQAKA